MILNRILAGLLALALASLGLAYVKHLHGKLAAKEAALAQASAALTAASKALEQAAVQARQTQAQLSTQYAREADHEKQVTALRSDLDGARAVRVRIPRAPTPAASAPPGSAAPSISDATPASGPGETDARAVEALLGTIFARSIDLAGEAQRCGIELTGLQAWVREHLADHHGLAGENFGENPRPREGASGGAVSAPVP